MSFFQYGNALIGLLGVLIGVLITPMVDYIRARAERKREASYAAIRIVSLLEEYSDACIDVVRDDGTIFGEPGGITADGERYHCVQVNAPLPIKYPDDISWKSLSHDQMFLILSLPDMARDVDRAIDISSLIDDYSWFFADRQEGYAKLALEAINLIGKLRDEFKIQSTGRINLHGNWDRIAFLKSEIEKFERQKTTA